MFCEACSEGTYSLKKTVDETTTCKYCGDNEKITNCRADEINLKKGISLIISYGGFRCSQPFDLIIVLQQIIGGILIKVIRSTVAMVSLMDVKEAYKLETRRVLLDMMQCYVDHVVKVITQIYIIQSIIIIQPYVAVLLDII